MATDNSNAEPMNDVMDFRPRPSAAFASAFSECLDRAIKEAREAKDAKYRATSDTVKRPGIGAGRLGNDCLRAIAYEYHRTPKDPGREFSGQLYRIFDRGHWGEASMAGYLRLLGFTLLTETAKGSQFRFDIMPYEDGKGRAKGFADGVVTAGPSLLTLGDPEQTCQAFRLSYPMLWENKELGNKSFGKLIKGGLRAYGGDYFPQTQLGMFRLGLTDNPALFTCKNADTQEVYAELIPPDPAFIQSVEDKLARIIPTTDPEQMDRIASKSTDFRCKMCDFPERCWRERERPQVDYGNAGEWSFGQRG